MPKLKPHKGVRKRFRVTKTGKVVKANAFTGHMKTSKSAKRKRRLRRPGPVSSVETKRIKRMLGLV